MQLHLLQSKGFLISLAILLVNDFILKYQFPCWLTGKLSDFAGLFVFALFWIAFFPKNRKTVLSTIALIFCWWKSPLSQPFIEEWNQTVFFSISRVVDYSDLIALTVLIAAWKYCNYTVTTIRFSPILASGISVFAFCATSAPPPSLYEFPNPQVFIYKYSIDSTNVFEKEISTSYFEKDSNDVYRPPRDLHARSHRYSNPNFINPLYKIELINDNELIINELATEYYSYLNNIKTKSGKVRYLERLKKQRENIAQNFWNNINNIHAEPFEYALEEGATPIYSRSFKFFPIELEPIKDTVEILTRALGNLEKFHFVDSKLDGLYQQFWDSSTLKIKGNYQSGIENGIWEFYDSLGTKIKEEQYQQGELVHRIFFKEGKRRFDNNVFTKDKIINTHIVFTIIFILLFVVSFYFYKKWYRPLPENEVGEKGVINFLLRLFGVFNWDLPFNFLEGFYLLPLLFSVLITMGYLIATNRFRDIPWMILWLVFILLLLGEYNYLTSF